MLHTLIPTSIAPRLALGVLLSASVALAQTPRAQFTSYGAGCAGSNGVPTLTAAALPVFGTTLDIALDHARPGATAFVVIGQNQLAIGLGPMGAPGCMQLTSIDDHRTVVVDGNGHAAARFRIPLDGALAGARIFCQAVVHDPGINQLGFVTSNGGDFVIGVEPQLQVRTFGPTTTSPTGVIQIRGQAFGTDPRAFCLRAIDTVNNDQVLLIGESITTVGNEQVLRARVSALGPRFVSGQLMMMRGVSRNAVPIARGRLSAPRSLWAVEGVDLPENNAILGTLTIDRPENPVNFTYDWVWSATANGNQMELRFPLNDPCTGSPIWPVLTRIWTNADVRIRATGANPPPDTWYDTEFAGVTVQAGSTTGLNVALDHAAQLRDLYSARYGAVPFTITGGVCPNDSTKGCITIVPTAGYEIVGTGTLFGHMRVDCPERSDVFMLTPQVLTTVDTTAAIVPIANPLPDQALALASSPSGETAVVLDFGFNPPQQLHVFVASSGAHGSVPLSGLAAMTAVDTSARGYALAIGAGQVVCVSLQTTTVVATLCLPSPADRIVCSPNGRFALCSSFTNRDVHLVEVSPAGALSFRTTLPAGATTTPGVGAIAFNPSWPRACSANLDGSITEFYIDIDSGGGWVFSPAGNTPNVLPAGTLGVDIAFRDDGLRGYVVAAAPSGGAGWHLIELTMSEANGSFVLANAVLPFLSETLPPVLLPRYLAVSDVGRKLFVHNGDQVRVFNIDAVTPTQLASTPLVGGIVALARRLR